MKKINNQSKPNILVYVDFMGSEEQIPTITKFLKLKKNITFIVTDKPEVYRDNISAYTHVFVDFGGLMQPGNSLFSTFCCEWDKIIEEHPNIYFIFFSCMGSEWFQDDMYNINLPNVIHMHGFSDVIENFDYIIKK